jgi:hypothetical protein
MIHCDTYNTYIKAHDMCSCIKKCFLIYVSYVFRSFNSLKERKREMSTLFSFFLKMLRLNDNTDYLENYKID